MAKSNPKELLAGVKPPLPEPPSAEDLAVLKEFERRKQTAATAEKCRKSLFEFVVAAWHVLEPGTPFILNWHINALCESVQMVLDDWREVRAGTLAKARVQNLLINVPPGTTKSRIICVMAPCWMWLDSPEWRCIVFSGNESISSRDSVYRRDLLESEWYQDTFRPEWKLKDDQNAKLQYNNNRGGFHQAKTAGQRVTGDRADALLVDDPNDTQTVGSEEIRTKINELWWDAGAYNRVNEPKTSVRIGIQQRLHEDDWSGHCLRQMTRGKPVWWHLCLPQEYEPKTKCPCGRDVCALPALGDLDPRTKAGELLFEARFPRDVLDEELERLGESGYAGQHQQRPYPKGGGALKRAWFRFYDPTQVDTLRFDIVFQSWDLSFKNTKTSDFVCGQVWAIKGHKRYLLDQYHKRADLPDTLKAIREMSKRWPKAVAKYIEDKANGPGVIATLRNELAGIIAVNPQGGKEARAAAVAPLIEGGSVYLPSPTLAPWVEGLLVECEAFPNGLHDDRVDAMTQGLVKTLAMRFEPEVDNRSEPERLWAGIEDDEIEKRDAQRMWMDSGFGNELDPMPPGWTPNEQP